MFKRFSVIVLLLALLVCSAAVAGVGVERQTPNAWAYMQQTVQLLNATDTRRSNVDSLTITALKNVH